VPLYVRDNTTVIGLNALERFVLATGDAHDSEAPPMRTLDAALDPVRESLLVQRERELAEQERALIRMAEGLTAREGELNRLQEQLDTARVDLEIREHELSANPVRDAEQPVRGVANWTEVAVARGNDNDASALEAAEQARMAVTSSGGLAASAHAGGAGARSHPPPLPARVSRSGPPPLPLRTRGGPPPLIGTRRDSDEPRNSHTSAPPPLPHHSPLPASVSSDKQPEPEIAPPVYFAGQRVGQMALKLVADELWLFVHLEEQRASAFRRGVDLLLQYVEVEAYPVMVLSLVSQNQEPHAIRLALDGHADTDLRVIEHLSRSFRARVALYIGGGYCETLTVATLREGVAQAIVEAIAKLPSERPPLGAAEAMVRVLHAPPPLWNDDLPFGPARREASTTATVLASVDQLSSWLRPEKLSEATLTYCVPRNVIDATIRRVLRAAVAFGVALPEELIQLALEHRAARDESSLVRSQLQAFRQRIEHGENDLGAALTRGNWSRLFTQADKQGVEIDDAIRLLADALSGVASVRPDATRLLRAFEGFGPEELKVRLQSDADRLEAIRELCVRGHASALELVLAALEGLTPRELARAVAHVLLFGEAAGDGLIAALRSPDDALRQMAALALGRLKLRRALSPLVQQLEAEESAICPELARAFGDFGAAALRTLVRAIPGASRPERLALALAHLANHGAAKEVEKLENDADAAVAQAARKAMSKRSRMEWEDLAVREQRTLDGEPATLLSQAFYAELAKVAI
jgi:hypothetical protein